MTMALEQPISYDRRSNEDDLPYIRRVGACRDGRVDMSAEGFTRPLGAQAMICMMCPISQLCLDYALKNDPKGEWDDVWGGLTSSQRTALHSRRERVHCPGCGSDAVLHQSSAEICISCGISWRC